MSVEQAMDSGSSLFRGFGFTSERPQNLVPMTPEMQKAMLATNAHIEAQAAKAEAKINTSEGRKKAAEAELAERQRKKNNWASRVIIDRGNGWKPIWGTVEDEELKIYTLLDSGEHRFWGIKTVGMGIFDFWDKYDPEVRRCEDRQQETPMNPDAPTGPLIGEPPRSIPLSNKAATKLRKRQKTPEINDIHRVRKSNKDSPKINKNARKSIADRFDAEHSRLEDQAQETIRTDAESGRSTRNKKATTASGAQQAATKDSDSVLYKRPRGRPPIKEKLAKKSPKQKKTPAVKGKLAEKLPKQEKTPAVKGNARVTKSSQTKRRPSAPSTHKMRTRGEGPAELLQLP